MDAELFTQSETCSLLMRGIELFCDGSGGHCQLDVKSHPFQGQVVFFFDNPSLIEFADQLAELERTLLGRVRLGNVYEDPYIEFEGNGRGHVVVRGTLCVTGDHMQQLDFEFKTDQTALGPFIHQLRSGVHS